MEGIVKTELKYIFSNINDWLKFAEAKHGALITFNTAAIFGVLQLWGASTQYKELGIFIVIIFSLSILLSLYSFIPVFSSKVDCITDADFQTKKESLNILYFKDLHILNQNQLLELIANKCGTTETCTKFDINLARQIINNARITNTKFRFFSVAGFVTWSGVLSFILLLIFVR
ncbi:hypothetical protein [Emticicia fontis]